LNNSGLEFSNFLVILNLFQDLVFIFPDITELALRKSAVSALRNLSGVWVELKDFSVNLGFLANSVLSNDFCFFSSRKRREIYCFLCIPVQLLLSPNYLTSTAMTTKEES